MTPPAFEGPMHGDGRVQNQLELIIHLLHKLNRKVDRLNPDFTKEDSAVRDMTQKVKDATGRVPPRVPPITNKGA